MISCKQATELMSQGQDRPLTPSERIGLRIHLLFCAGCVNFRRQLDFLRNACRRLSGRE